MDVASKINEIIAEQLNQDADGIDANAHFVNDLGADSLDVVELVMAFEEAFDLEIPDEDAEKIQTVQDAINYIQGKQG
jgi:acyl carrier protein